MKAIITLAQDALTYVAIVICSLLFSSPIIAIAILATTQDEMLKVYGVMLLAFSCSIIGYIAGKQGMFDKR